MKIGRKKGVVKRLFFQEMHSLFELRIKKIKLIWKYVENIVVVVVVIIFIEFLLYNKVRDDENKTIEKLHGMTEKRYKA